MINIGGWNSLPGSETRGALGTVPIGLRATLCLILQIYVWSSLVILVISVSIHPSLPIIVYVADVCTAITLGYPERAAPTITTLIVTVPASAPPLDTSL